MNEAVNESLTNIAKARELIIEFRDRDTVYCEMKFLNESVDLLDKTLELLSKV